MSVPVVLPNSSNFLGVAMVIRSRDGPRWVFHYPPHIHDHQARQAPHANEDEWDEEDFGTVDQLPRETTLDAARGNLPRAAELLAWNHDDHFVTESGVHLVPWEHVAGFPTKDLESILTPSRAYAKKLFQISLDPLHFVSHPIYVPETGNWKKVRKPPKVRRGTSTGGRDSDHVDPRDTGLGQGPSERILQGSDMERKDSARPAVSPAAEEAPDKVANMNMFNLVFILKPKRQDAKELVNIMYTHIIREVNKAYKYAQQRSEFVWKESKKIMLIKDKAREESTFQTPRISRMRFLCISRC